MFSRKTRNQNQPLPQHPYETNSRTNLLNKSTISTDQQQMTMPCSRRKTKSLNKESVLESFSKWFGETPLNKAPFPSNQQQMIMPFNRRKKASLDQEKMESVSGQYAETAPLNGSIFSSNQQQMIMSCSRRKKPSLNQESLGSFSGLYDEAISLNGCIFSSNQQQMIMSCSRRKKPSLNQESLGSFSGLYDETTSLNGCIFSSNQQQMIMSCSRRKKPSLNQESLGIFSGLYDETTSLNGCIFSSNQQQMAISCSERKKPNINQLFLEYFYYLEITPLNESILLKFLWFYEICKSFLHPHVSREIIFFELPKLCFRRQLENSTAITKVLLTIHQFPRTALPHVVFFLAFNTVCNFILPRNSPDGAKRERTRYVSFLAFFLEHCNAEKFTIDGKRVTEMMEAADPVLYARLLVFSDSNCVLALLQHGLRFNESKDESNMHPIFLYILARLSQFAPCMMHQDLYGSRSVPRKFVTLLTNFKIILKSTYNPRAVIFQMAAITEREFNIFVDPINSFLKFANQDEDIKSQSPPTLKHLCRYVIRQRLYENWNLPHGIRQLPVKSRLMSYLQLCAE